MFLATGFSHCPSHIELTNSKVQSEHFYYVTLHRSHNADFKVKLVLPRVGQELARPKNVPFNCIFHCTSHIELTNSKFQSEHFYYVTLHRPHNKDFKVKLILPRVGQELARPMNVPFNCIFQCTSHIELTNIRVQSEHFNYVMLHWTLVIMGILLGNTPKMKIPFIKRFLMVLMQF